MKRIAHVMLALLCMLQACTPKVKTQIVKRYAPIGNDQEIVVFEMGEVFPDDSEEVGNIKITDSGFTTKCTYEIVINNAKDQARKAGGNAIAVTEHIAPNFGSTCHRIKAKILRLRDPEGFLKDVDNIIEDKDIALLHIYRFGGMGALVGYNLYLGDSIICRVKSNWKETLVIKKPVNTILWARTEARTEIPIQVELGREYYIRCGITMGAMVGHPSIDLVNVRSGKTEFDSVKGK